jgi:hypothetical protein
MHHQRCVCPQCGTTLRVKDRAYLNRPVPCPDCRTPLVLKATKDDQLEVALAAPSADSVPAQPVPKTMAAQTSHPVVQRLRDWSTNVTVISWAAALLVAAMIGVAVYSTRKPSPNRHTDVAAQPPVPAVNEKENRPDETPSALSQESEPTEAMADAVPSPDSPEAPLDPAELPAPVASESITEDIPPADAAVAVAEAAALQPAVVAAEPPLPKVDLDAALAQPLKAFRQSRSSSRRELLDLMEEMLGAPIRYDVIELGDAAKPLDQKLSLDLQDVTVADVLAKVLDKTELSFVREPDGLRLQKKDAADDEKSSN